VFQPGVFKEKNVGFWDGGRNIQKERGMIGGWFWRGAEGGVGKGQAHRIIKEGKCKVSWARLQRLIERRGAGNY